MVRLSMVLAVSPNRAPRLMDALWSLMVPTRLEPGCLLCTAWSEPDSTVHYLEEWATEQDMQRRVRSDTFTSVLGIVEAAEKTPEVRFDFLSSTRGLDYITEIREGGLADR
jgi:quinol monooxygenase YgiN